MNVVEEENLIKTINGHVSGHNGWNSINKFFKENKDIQPILEEVSRKLIADGCYSTSTIYIATIEKLLEIIADNKDVEKQF